jgi:hypothetical protein
MTLGIERLGLFREGFQTKKMFGTAVPTSFLGMGDMIFQ